MFTDENGQVWDDSICQWVYNAPKRKKNGKPNTNRKKIGFVVAEKVDGVINFGWSKCASHDKFDQDLARQIAYGRLIEGTNTPMPSVFKKFMPEFIIRCMKYYQVNTIQAIDFHSDPINWDQQ